MKWLDIYQIKKELQKQKRSGYAITQAGKDVISCEADYLMDCTEQERQFLLEQFYRSGVDSSIDALLSIEIYSMKKQVLQKVKSPHEATKHYQLDDITSLEYHGLNTSNLKGQYLDLYFYLINPMYRPLISQGFFKENWNKVDVEDETIVIDENFKKIVRSMNASKVAKLGNMLCEQEIMTGVKGMSEIITYDSDALEMLSQFLREMDRNTGTGQWFYTTLNTMMDEQGKSLSGKRDIFDMFKGTSEDMLHHMMRKHMFSKRMSHFLEVMDEETYTSKNAPVPFVRKFLTAGVQLTQEKCDLLMHPSFLEYPHDIRNSLLRILTRNSYDEFQIKSQMILDGNFQASLLGATDEQKRQWISYLDCHDTEILEERTKLFTESFFEQESEVQLEQMHFIKGGKSKEITSERRRLCTLDGFMEDKDHEKLMDRMKNVTCEDQAYRFVTSAAYYLTCKENDASRNAVFETLPGDTREISVDGITIVIPDYAYVRKQAEGRTLTFESKERAKMFVKKGN